MRSAALFGFACLFAATLFVASAQDSPKTGAKTQNDTFSGNIVELLPGKLTVSRSILGGQPEKRTFLITADTKIQGKLHVKAKVTVGFVTTDDGDVVARLIVVRQPRK